MKKPIVVLNILILSLLVLPTASAKPSDIFIDHLTDLIWADCQGKDIHINGNISYCIGKTCTTVIPWPYDRAFLRQFLKQLGEHQSNFSTFMGTCENKIMYTSGINGCGILTIGSIKLNINGDNYYWNNTKVDVPEEVLKINQGPNSTLVETHGPNSPVTTGPNSSINQQGNNIHIELSVPKESLAVAIIGAIVAITAIVLKKRKRSSIAAKKNR